MRVYRSWAKCSPCSWSAQADRVSTSACVNRLVSSWKASLGSTELAEVLASRVPSPARQEPRPAPRHDDPNHPGAHVRPRRCATWLTSRAFRVTCNAGGLLRLRNIFLSYTHDFLAFTEHSPPFLVYFTYTSYFRYPADSWQSHAFCLLANVKSSPHFWRGEQPGTFGRSGRRQAGKPDLRGVTS